MRLGACVIVMLGSSAMAGATPTDGQLLDAPVVIATPNTDEYEWTESGDLQIDAGLSVGFPTALTTGLSKGVGGGISCGHCALRWGVRAAWMTATEYSRDWAVTHSDTHLRLTGAAHKDVGRGGFAIRLGVGPTLVHESRIRNQGKRAGLSGSDLETSAFKLVPAADLEGLVSVHLVGAWMFVLSGGPSVSRLDGDFRYSWNAEVGVAWSR
jgi:hypothetical protein